MYLDAVACARSKRLARHNDRRIVLALARHVNLHAVNRLPFALQREQQLRSALLALTNLRLVRANRALGQRSFWATATAPFSFLVSFFGVRH